MGYSLTPAIILCRMVPHYRLAILEELYRRYGWLVATAATPPAGTALNTVTDRPFIRPFAFRFPRSDRPYLCQVPLHRILADLRPRAVIAEFSLQMSSSYALALRRSLGWNPPALFWSHGYNVRRGFATPTARAIQTLRAKLAARVDGHICYGPEGKAFLDRHMNPNRVFVALNTLGHPGPMAPQTTGAAERSSQDRPPDPGRTTLVAIGRLVPEKAVPRLVRVVRRLHAENPAVRLVVIGDGPERNLAEADAGPLVAAGVITFTGAIYNEDVLARLFAEADAAVFAGVVGLGANHALLHGAPILALPPAPLGPAHCPEFIHIRPGLTGLLATDGSDQALLALLRDFVANIAGYRAILRPHVAAYARAHLGLPKMLEGFEAVNAYLTSGRGTC